MDVSMLQCGDDVMLVGSQRNALQYRDKLTCIHTLELSKYSTNFRAANWLPILAPNSYFSQYSRLPHPKRQACIFWRLCSVKQHFETVCYVTLVVWRVRARNPYCVYTKKITSYLDFVVKKEMACVRPTAHKHECVRNTKRFIKLMRFGQKL